MIALDEIKENTNCKTHPLEEEDSERLSSKIDFNRTVFRPEFMVPEPDVSFMKSDVYVSKQEIIFELVKTFLKKLIRIVMNSKHLQVSHVEHA